MASSVSENSSFANLLTASSNDPAMTGSAVAIISKNANGNARTALKTLVNTGRPRQEQKEGGGYRRLPGLFTLRSKSGALTAALVGLGIPVTAFLADPVADQVLGAIELLRPGIAGHQARGLPHHIELAVAFDFANEHRLGDVMVRKHLWDAAGQGWRFETGQSVDHLVGVGRLHFLHCLDPHIEPDDVRFHRIVGGALRVLGVGLPVLDELLVRRRLDRLEVVPGGEMAEQGLGVDTGEFFFTDRERDNRN